MKHKVLDQGYVELQAVMGDDLSIVQAARVSSGSESKGEEADKKLLRYLYENRHTSPFEQVEFKFRVKAPVIVWWQWVRHRTWSFNAQSGRYSKLDEDFYIPAEWRGKSSSNKQGSTEGVFTDSENGDLSSGLANLAKYCYELYENALKAGVAREQARLFLPGFSSYYTWICKADAHNLMHFLRLRMAPDAQWEIRQYAETIYRRIFREVLPWTAELFEEGLKCR